MKRKITITVFLILLTTGISLYLFCSLNHPNFSGECESNRSSYSLDIEYMNGIDSHRIELKKGKTLEIQFKTEQGSIYMTISSPDGSVLYSGNGKAANNFTLPVLQSGTYTVTIEARHAKGAIHIGCKEEHTQ